MKIILAGATGFAGQEVLEKCLENPDITSIVALSRRDLSPSVTSNPKLKVVIMEDFLSYPDTVLEEIKGAKACIWVLGVTPTMSQLDSVRKVSIDYTIAAAKAFSQVSALDGGDAKKFRFVYCSGGAAERDTKKTLWFLQDYRRIRGQAENDLLAFTKEHQDTFESCILRPGMILPKGTTLKGMVLSLAPSVKVDVLAAVMLRVALNGSKDQILENSALV